MENKKLAIKGHKTRGKEVIEILTMLGGKNKFNFRGNEDKWFVLNGNIQWSNFLFDEKGFTLEEFLEKYPFKVGDKAIVKGLPEYPKSINFMKWFDGNIHYSFDNETWFIPSALQPYKEEIYTDLAVDNDSQTDKTEKERAIDCIRLAIELASDGGIMPFTEKEYELMYRFLDEISKEFI